MHRVHPPTVAAEHPDHVRLSFRDPQSWIDSPPAGGHLALLLLGDELEGPFAVAATTRPTDGDAPRGPAHGHESDTWRITLLGSSPMGNEVYGAGEFRYQIGARSYGADGYAYGPDGGYHLVMFGDRRGFPTQPVKQEHAERFAKDAERGAAAYGIDIPEVYPPIGRGVATTIGTLDKAGKVNGSFDDADRWAAVLPGVRVSAGVFGHQVVGPLLLMVRAEAATSVLPASQLGTEVMVMVVRGSCTVGDDHHDHGDVRIQRPDAPMGEIVAGDRGADLCVLLADRSCAGLDALSDSCGWRVTPTTLLEQLLAIVRAPAA